MPVVAAIPSQADLVSVVPIRKSQAQPYPRACMSRGCCMALRTARVGIQVDICAVLTTAGAVACLHRRLLFEAPSWQAHSSHQALGFASL